ncbi:MAG: LCP family protein [Erysipelotrichaceae bacterium]|nr:LCP family protein [Erysipelotrichaceae bacterium]
MSEKPQLSREEKKRRILYRKRRKLIFPVARLTALIMAAITLVFFIVIAFLGVLPFKYVAIIGLVLLIINAILAVLAFGRRIKNSTKVFQTVTSWILCVLMIIGSVKLPAYKSKIEKMFNKVPLEKEVVYNVYVMNDSSYGSMKDLESSILGVQRNMNDEEVTYIFDRLSNEMNTKNTTQKNCHSVIDAVNKLYNGIADAVILKESSASILNGYDEYKDFATKARILYTFKRTERLSFETDAVKSITTTPFIVGIVGNDEWFLDDISKTDGFRSDVNMLVVVNPNTSQVLLISVPRDSYVALDGDSNKMDKLTHATVTTGIEGWINTLEGMLDINMNYFVKVNFSSVVRIIDALGGIDVDNPYAFRTNAYAHFDEKEGERVYEWISFSEGPIHLNGEEALAYVRERYSLPDGDLGRNMHQTLVVKALVKKAVSPDIISKVDRLLDALKGTFLTNMETKQILELGRMQLDKNPDWEIMNVALKGYVDYAYSWELNDERSMLMLDSESVNKATYYIKALLNGERISVGN